MVKVRLAIEEAALPRPSWLTILGQTPVSLPAYPWLSAFCRTAKSGILHVNVSSACEKFFKGGLTNRELRPKCPFTAALDRMVRLLWQPKGTDAGLLPEGRGR